MSFHSSHHPLEVLLAQFISLYVHKGDLKPHSFHFNGGPGKNQGAARGGGGYIINTISTLQTQDFEQCEFKDRPVS